MFNMVENAGDNNGYQLRITYDAGDNLYTVNGYVIYTAQDGWSFDYDKDGASVHFGSLEAALDWILDYKTVDPNEPKQLELPFDEESK